MVLNEGMPHQRNPFDKGRLIITFKVGTDTMWLGEAKRSMCGCLHDTCMDGG